MPVPGAVIVKADWGVSSLVPKFENEYFTSVFCFFFFPKAPGNESEL